MTPGNETSSPHCFTATTTVQQSTVFVNESELRMIKCKHVHFWCKHCQSYMKEPINCENVQFTFNIFLFSHDFYFTCEQWVNYFMMLRDSMPLSRFPSRLIVPISLTCRWLAFWIFNPRGLPLFVSFPVLALCSCLSRPSFTRFECGWVFHIFCILPSFLCFLLFFFYQLSLNFPLFHHLPAWRLLFCCQLNINMWKKPDNI